MSRLEEVLDRIESRLGLICEAITTNHQEVIQAVSNIGDTINADIDVLTKALTDFAAEWQQVSQRLAMEAPQIDTSKLDALAQQAQAMDAAWKAQLAPDTTGSAVPAEAAPAADTGTATGTETGSATGTDTTGPAADTTGPAADTTGQGSAGDTGTPAGA